MQNCSDYKSSVIVNERGTPPCCNRQKFLFLFQDAASHVEGLPRTKLIRHVVPTPLLTTNCSTIILIRVNTFINQLFLDYHFYIVMNLCQKECYPFSCSIFCCFLRLIKWFRSINDTIAITVFVYILQLINGWWIWSFHSDLF